MLVCKSKFESLPTDVLNIIFDYLDNDSKERMYQVSSTFSRRKIDGFYPKKLIDVFEKYGRPIHQLPVLPHENRQPFNRLSFHNTPHALMRLPSKKKLFGVVLRINIQAARFFEEEMQKVEQEFGDIFDSRFQDKVTQPMPFMYELAFSTAVLTILNRGTVEQPDWRYRVSGDDHYLLDRWVARVATKQKKSSLFYFEQAFEVEEECYAFLDYILSDKQPDFQIFEEKKKPGISHPCCLV